MAPLAHPARLRIKAVRVLRLRGTRCSARLAGSAATVDALLRRPDWLATARRPSELLSAGRPRSGSRIGERSRWAQSHPSAYASDVRPAVLAVVAAGARRLRRSRRRPPGGTPDPLHTYNGRVIRGWLLSLERQDYAQAAYYFAPNALIDQGHPYRLKTKSDAFAFNAALPCRADLIRMAGGGTPTTCSRRSVCGAARAASAAA